MLPGRSNTVTWPLTAWRPFSSSAMRLVVPKLLPSKNTCVESITVTSAINWDLRNSIFTESRVGMELHWQCWALSFEFVNREQQDTEFRFALNLLGVGGPIGTSVGLGAITPGGLR